MYKVLLNIALFILFVSSSVCFANSVETENINSKITEKSKTITTQSKEKIHKIISFREFDNFIKGSNLYYTKQKILKLNEKEFLIFGGEKHYISSSKKSRKGSLIKAEKYIFKLNIDKNEFLPICQINDNLIINIHPINNEKVLLVGEKSIGEYDIKLNTYQNIVSFDFNLLYDTDKSYFVDNKVILVNSSQGKIYSVDIQNKEITFLNDLFKDEKVFYVGNILLDNKILFFNGLNLLDNWKEIDYNIIYLIDENKFEKELLFGKINKIHKISNNEYLLLNYSKNEEDNNIKNEYSYNKALLYDLENKKLIKKLEFYSNYFESVRGIIAKFNLQNLGEKILFIENDNNIKQSFDVNKKIIEKYKNKKFQNIGKIQNILEIDKNKYLIITDIGIYIYK